MKPPVVEFHVFNPSLYLSFGRGFGNPFSFSARLPGLYRVPIPPSTSAFRQLWDGKAFYEQSWSYARSKFKILCHAGIPNYDGEVPEREVRAEYPFGYTVKPNDTITSGTKSAKMRVTSTNPNQPGWTCRFGDLQTTPAVASRQFCPLHRYELLNFCIKLLNTIISPPQKQLTLSLS